MIYLTPPNDAILRIKTVELNDRQRDTIIAALRFWQSIDVEERKEFPEWDIAADHYEPLDDGEIDMLIEQGLNR